MAVSKRLRYEIFRRDGHTCHYCGAKAPDVELTVDHVIPKALGGTDDPSNLVTACRDCNGGKTSSSPDAPIVTQVAEDALQWAQAMRQAQAQALADLKARQADRQQFAQWWDNWTYEHEGTRHTIPRPGDWGQTVDQLVSAGLPLPLLKDCIDRAMGREKVRNDEKFRYMCGVAWRKLTELQETARSIASGSSGADSEDEDPAFASGRADLARELLGLYHADELPRLLAEAREDRGAQTEDEAHIEAAIIAWLEMYAGLGWLAHSVCDLLAVIPDEVISDAQHQARIELYDEDGPGFTRAKFAELAADIATRTYEENAARTYLDALPEGERAEWVAYAEARATPTPLTGRWAVINPARIARYVKETHLPYPGMCLARGKHIERCPFKATHYLQFAEFDCCQDAGEDHDPHIFCDKHTQMAEAGELTRNNEPVTIVARHPFTEAEEAVPF